ncbi:alpha-(1,3)-fucosyltransferase C-like [Bacillus rossius redtenbacheri]|uniref:alpha-(1,3)-fucosyltransferase C-like n=1 Tax=Bacillus rossius redtenbacheri TaxID=93214 RepID=UPI002FDCB536
MYYNSYFDDPHYEFGLGREPFVRSGCPIDTCEVVQDAPHGEVDAVIFHLWNLGRGEARLKALEAQRRPHQRYVFFLMEAPGVYLSDLRQFRDFFNWTMSYRADSDVFRPYGELEPLAGGSRRLDAPWELPGNSTAGPAPAGKTGLVAWLVSKCRTPSQREVYARELAKHVQVDVYGRCGPLSCAGRMSEECYEMLDRKYKFYLSFENSLCRDYVTEKLFRVLRHRVVPVVYGGADYSRFAPPGSYIDVRDFASPRDLAERLKSLAASPREYERFFRWKQRYRVSVTPMPRAMCRLCAMLHDPALPPKSYGDLQEWYSGAGVCHAASAHWRGSS